MSRINPLRAITFFSLGAGCLLRIIYTSYTAIGTRTHDVYSAFGHLEYIRYVAYNLNLPGFNTAQAYHPPFHHILGAIFFRLGGMLHYDELSFIKAFQYFMALLSCTALLLIYDLFRILKSNDITMAIAIPLVSFQPGLIMLAAKINNDNTLFFMLTLSLYFLIRWMNRKSYKNIIGLAVSFSLAVLTKVSGAYFIVIIAAAFIAVMIKNRGELRLYIKQYIVFTVIAAPLSLSYIVRNYILFRQPVNYVLDFGKSMDPSVINTIFTPLWDLLLHPFNNTGLKGNSYFLDFFIKSISFSEFEFSGLVKMAGIMNILVFVFMLLTLVFIVSSFLNKGKIIPDVRFVMLLNLVIPAGLLVVLRFSHPVQCSQDFRYIVQILISVGFFLGRGISNLAVKKRYGLAAVITAALYVYCIMSVIFILDTRFYH